MATTKAIEATTKTHYQPSVRLHSFQSTETYGCVTMEYSYNHLFISSGVITSQLALFSLLADPLVAIHVSNVLEDEEYM